MDPRRGQTTADPAHLGRRTREERRSLSESLADGTSKFFTSMVAKKNGLFSDLSSKIETTFGSKPDVTANSLDSNTSSTNTTSIANSIPTHTPPPRPPPPRRLPSVGNERGRDNVIKRMSSMPAYTRTDSRPDVASSGRPSNQETAIRDQMFSVNGMNVSFDEPIYSKQETTAFEPDDDNAFEAASRGTRNIISDSSVGQPNCQPRPLPRSQKPPGGVYPSDRNQPMPVQARQNLEEIIQNSNKTRSFSGDTPNEVIQKKEETNIQVQSQVKQIHNNNNKVNNNHSNKPNTDTSKKNGSPDSGKDLGRFEDSSGKQKAPKFTTTKRRSSTVDEILFDDYVEPGVDDVISKDEPPENLISFEPDSEIDRSVHSSDSSERNDRIMGGASIDSSDGEFGGAQIKRSSSVGSDKSWSSNYSIDSQPDEVTLECMSFMKSFVDKVFHNGEDITQTEKAKFGELCQYIPGRLWFSRYVNSQRVNNKKVSEPVFFRLMQYFAVCLFECNEAEDFSPAKTLMNMCFTFFYEAQTAHGHTEKIFLYTYMRDQPIWQSLRFWNAAYFDAVQNERSRRPMPTSSDGSETVSDDKQFQENITFGQLGTFGCNMRAFGLSKELCMEFLRKQSTIANLRKDQVKLLRDNIDKVKET